MPLGSQNRDHEAEELHEFNTSLDTKEVLSPPRFQYETPFQKKKNTKR